QRRRRLWRRLASTLVLAPTARRTGVDQRAHRPVRRVECRRNRAARSDERRGLSRVAGTAGRDVVGTAESVRQTSTVRVASPAQAVRGFAILWSAVALYRFSNLRAERRPRAPAAVAPKCGSPLHLDTFVQRHPKRQRAGALHKSQIPYLSR